MDEQDRIRTHRDLKVWQLGMELTESVYDLTNCFPDCERFGLVSQLRRAAVSAPLILRKEMRDPQPRNTFAIFPLQLAHLPRWRRFSIWRCGFAMANRTQLTNYWKSSLKKDECCAGFSDLCK
jgi:hypothetical protein